MTWQEIVTLAAMLITGVLASWLAQLIKGVAWPDMAKLALSWVLSFAVGLGDAWLAGDVLGFIAKAGEWTAVDVIAFGGVVWTGSQAFFYLYFKPKQRADTSAPGA
ncbi:MAG: hypothetical protein PHS80_14030 [Methanothrix sp.]|nr:hypothetical protein [Methanothrix sp.]